MKFGPGGAARSKAAGEVRSFLRSTTFPSRSTRQTKLCLSPRSNPTATFIPCSISCFFDKLSTFLLSFFLARHSFVSSKEDFLGILPCLLPCGAKPAGGSLAHSPRMTSLLTSSQSLGLAHPCHARFGTANASERPWAQDPPNGMNAGGFSTERPRASGRPVARSGDLWRDGMLFPQSGVGDFVGLTTTCAGVRPQGALVPRGATRSEDARVDRPGRILSAHKARESVCAKP